jgi:hypothetical protein
MAQYSSSRDQHHSAASLGDDYRQYGDDSGHVPLKTPLRMQQFEYSPRRSEASLSKQTFRRSATYRIGWMALFTLLSTLIVVIGAVGFLLFLWSGTVDNMVWQAIMIREWGTRAVTITALAVRTSVGLQAGIAVAMLASLLLESSSGTKLVHAPAMSIARATEAVSVFLLQPIWSGLSPGNAFYSAVLTLLIATSILLQFGSTVLVSDMSLGQLPGFPVDQTIPYDFTYERDRWWRETVYNRTKPPEFSQALSWQVAPAMYPSFAEHNEAVENPGVDDTGVLLRALLPFQDAQSRETLRSYSGKALVLDARVSCQPPIIRNFNSSHAMGDATNLTGSFVPSRPDVTGLWTKHSDDGSPFPVPFNCSLRYFDGVALCAMVRWSDSHPGPELGLGGLISQFADMSDDSDSERVPESRSRYAGPYLIFSYGGQSHIPTGGSPDEAGPWTFVPNATRPTRTEEDGDIVDTGNIVDTGLNITVCYTAWDIARLPVIMPSDGNRTEPTYLGNHAFSSSSAFRIAHQLAAYHNAGKNSERGILTLSKPSSWLPDPDDHLSGMSVFELGAVPRQPGNEDFDDMYQLSSGGMYNEECNDTIVDRVDENYRFPERRIRALFLRTLEYTKSPAQALSALVTTFSTMAYYDQMPFFDQNTTSTLSFYETVLFPRSDRGLKAFLAVLTTHLILVGLATILFITRSRHTFIGNYWQAIAQLRSSETDSILADSMLKDREVAAKMPEAKYLRVRLRVNGAYSQHDEGIGRVELTRRRQEK